MPDLPTISVTQAQMDRIIQVFPGATLAEKATAYREWLKERLIDRVRNHEMDVIRDRAEQEMSAKAKEVLSSLGF